MSFRLRTVNEIKYTIKELAGSARGNWGAGEEMLTDLGSV